MKTAVTVIGQPYAAIAGSRIAIVTSERGASASFTTNNQLQEAYDAVRALQPSDWMNRGDVQWSLIPAEGDLKGVISWHRA